MSDVCKHCTNAGCLDACPTGALIRTEFETVIVQPDICNGCGYCIPSCPFGVIDRDPYDGRAAKCTLCYDRLEDGLEPACAKACPTDSIQFGPYDELVELAKGRVAALHEQGLESAYLYGAGDERRGPARRRARRVLPAHRAARALRAAGPGRLADPGERAGGHRGRAGRRGASPRRRRSRACVIAHRRAPVSHAKGPPPEERIRARERGRAGDARRHARGRHARRAGALPARGRGREGGAREAALGRRALVVPLRQGHALRAPAPTTSAWPRPRAARAAATRSREVQGPIIKPGGVDVGGAAVLLVRRHRHRLLVRRGRLRRGRRPRSAAIARRVTLVAVGPAAPLLVMDLGRPAALPQHDADLQAALADVDGRVVPVGVLGRRLPRGRRRPARAPAARRGCSGPRPPCSAPTSAPTPASCSPPPPCRCGRAAAASSGRSSSPPAPRPAPPPTGSCWPASGCRSGIPRATRWVRSRRSRWAPSWRCRASTSTGWAGWRTRSRRARRASCSRPPSGWCARGSRCGSRARAAAPGSTTSPACSSCSPGSRSASPGSAPAARSARDHEAVARMHRTERADLRRRAGGRRLRTAGRGDARRGPAARRGARAPDAGAVARRPHPDRLLRDRVPRDVPVRRGAVPADGRRDLQGARQALVEGGAGAVRRRGRDRDDPVVRVRAAVAGLHGDVRRGVRDRVRARGHLVLRRGDLHRDLRLRLGPAVAARALPGRRADRDLRASPGRST